MGGGRGGGESQQGRLGGGLTCAKRCWLSGSPGFATAFRASSMRLPALSITSPAHSSMAAWA